VRLQFTELFLEDVQITYKKHRSIDQVPRKTSYFSKIVLLGSHSLRALGIDIQRKDIFESQSDWNGHVEISRYGNPILHKPFLLSDSHVQNVCQHRLQAKS